MQSAIGSQCEQAIRHRREMPRGGQRKVFLALEVMEEAALGQPSGQADVIDGGRRIALGTDHLQGRVQEFRLRLGPGPAIKPFVPSSLFAASEAPSALDVGLGSITA
jgi:hypothetical protein